MLAATFLHLPLLRDGATELYLTKSHKATVQTFSAKERIASVLRNNQKTKLLEYEDNIIIILSLEVMSGKVRRFFSQISEMNFRT